MPMKFRKKSLIALSMSMGPLRTLRITASVGPRFIVLMRQGCIAVR